jgi:hypothetical protein
MNGRYLSRPHAGLVALATVIALAGCATTPDPKPEIEAARSLVTQAERSGAPQFASAEMQSARAHLQQAEEADTARDDEEAQRHAAEAGIDAKLAMAKAAAAKAESAAQESARAVEALRDEANRPDAPSTVSPAPTP